MGAFIVAPIRIAFLPTSDQAGLRFQVLQAGLALLSGKSLSESVVSRGVL
jgi:hypothetical protein